MPLMETPLTNGVHPTILTPPEKRWIVQKFGGTSVGKFAETIVEDVVK